MPIRAIHSTMSSAIWTDQSLACMAYSLDCVIIMCGCRQNQSTVSLEVWEVIEASWFTPTEKKSVMRLRFDIIYDIGQFMILTQLSKKNSAYGISAQTDFET